MNIISTIVKIISALGPLSAVLFIILTTILGLFLPWFVLYDAKKEIQNEKIIEDPITFTKIVIKSIVIIDIFIAFLTTINCFYI